MKESAVLQGTVLNTSFPQRRWQKLRVVGLSHGSCSLLHCRSAQHLRSSAKEKQISPKIML